MTHKTLVREFLSQPLFLSRDNGDGFPSYLRAAQRERMDVNDWIESRLGWLPALPILEDIVFPLLTDSSNVCEVGVGTGRWSRHIVEKIPNGSLLLVDKSEWVTDFLRGYFRRRRNVKAVLGNGVSIPVREMEWADLVFSQGMFITLKLGHVFTYLKAFARLVKPSGVVVFDFVDPQTPEGWQFLLRESARAHDVFTYHALSVIEKCCDHAGFKVEAVSLKGKSTYVVARKRDHSLTH